MKPWSSIFQHLSIAVNKISRGTNKRYNRNPVCMALQLSEAQSYINLVCERVLCVLPIVTVNVILFLFRKDTIGKSEVKHTFSAALSAALKMVDCFLCYLVQLLWYNFLQLHPCTDIWNTRIRLPLTLKCTFIFVSIGIALSVYWKGFQKIWIVVFLIINLYILNDECCNIHYLKSTFMSYNLMTNWWQIKLIKLCDIDFRYFDKLQ